MLTVTIPATRLWDDDKEEFSTLIDKPITIQLEHSLVSLSKWESKWKKPFFGTKEDDIMSEEETTDYIRCMTITQNVKSEIYNYLPDDIVRQIKDYIGESMTATWFGGDNKKKQSKEIITAEVIYYQMITLNIPIEFQKWHLSRLLTLIKVCAIKSSEQPAGVDKKGKPKKMSQEQIKNRRAVNDARLKAMESGG